MPSDVPEIHNAAFRTILRALDQIRMGGEGTSIVITGAPGSGKTHLLGRLRNWIGCSVDEAVQEVIYIYVRCNASAATFWRHLQLSLASDLLRSGSLARLLRQRPDLDEVEDLNVARVLHCLREGRNRLIASAWLRGESLTDADSLALGIKVEPDDEERDREWNAKRVSHALLRFLLPAPAVLCFDQVEGLETYLGEQAGFRAFGQVISELHSQHRHLLLLSCIVSDYEHRFQESLIQADKDRIFQYVVNLKPIEWDLAMDIVRARLDAASAPAADRRAPAGDPWWPLDPNRLKPLFAATGLCLPRTLIQACRQQFDECMNWDLPGPGQREPTSLPEFLQEQYERNLADARRTAPREGADKILSESLPWLLQNSGMTVLGPDAGAARFSNLVYRGPAGETAVVYCFRRGVALTNALKRMSKNWNPAVGLKILSDPSIQPKEGSVGARVLRELKNRGARQSYPLPEALAALHAIRNLNTSARSGELTLDGRDITEPEITQWALANLAPQLEQLRADLSQEADEDLVLPALSALVAEKKVIDAGVAARELTLRAEEVAACARRHPMHFGLLEGPPLVLFQAVEGSPAETNHA
jgi:AAA ATPase domain